MAQHGGSEVSAVICCHADERYGDILAALSSLHSQLRADDEVVLVVDHNSALRKRLEQAALPTTQIVENRGVRGLSDARNTGVAVSSGAYIVFLDDDAVAAPGMVDAMRGALDADVKILGVAGWIKPIWIETERPRWFPSEFLWVVGCSYEGLKPGPVRNLIGAAMALRRGVFEEVGGFAIGVGRGEGKLPLGCEETELCIRAAAAFPSSTFILSAEASCDHKVPARRATWDYLVKRCFAEGLSKAHIIALSVKTRALGVEKHYVTRVLPESVRANIRDIFLKGDAGGFLRIFAVALGLAAAALGYAIGRTSFSRTAQGCKNGIAILGEAASRHTIMLAKGLTLATSNVLGAGLGFAFWWFAAHSLTPKAVGSAAATISLINLLGQAGEAGLGALLIGRIPRTLADAPALIATALVAAAAACFSLGALIVTIQFALGLGLDQIAGGWGFRAAFVLAVTITGITLVLDQALIGLLRAGTQMGRNIAFNLSKLALLAGAVQLWGSKAGDGAILAAWIIGSLVPLGLMAATNRWRGTSIYPRPRFGILRPLFLEVMGHHCINVSVLSPYFALPIVVAVTLSATANAAFYAVWSLINAALLIPAALTTILYSVGAFEPALLQSRLRLSLFISTALCLGVGLFLFFFSSNVLGVFNPMYPSIAAESLRLLGFGTLGVMIKFHYVTIRRLAGHTLKPAALLAAGAVIELGLAAFGGHLAGLRGVTIGWLAAQGLEASFMLPTLILSSHGQVTSTKFTRAVEIGAS